MTTWPLRLGMTLCCTAAWIAGALAFAADPPAAVGKQQARQILDATGVQGGLIVHLVCGDGRMTAAFAKDGYIVQGLEADEKQVNSARQFFASLTLDGKVTAEWFDGQHLPYLDNYVNLLVGEKPAALSGEEILRVLVPGGVAYLGHDFRWEKIVKPARAGVDEWTHYLHDASGNAVAHDTIVSPPRHLQWLADPEWSRTHAHMGSMMGLVSAQGRVFAIADEGSVAYPNDPANWSLSARDAYNGVLLWRIPIRCYQDHLWPDRSCGDRAGREGVVCGQRRGGWPSEAAGLRDRGWAAPVRGAATRRAGLRRHGGRAISALSEPQRRFGPVS